MILETLLQPLIYGLQIGVTYMLLALGLTVIFSIMNVINLAHGEFYMLGAFTVFYIAGGGKHKCFRADTRCFSPQHSVRIFKISKRI